MVLFTDRLQLGEKLDVPKLDSQCVHLDFFCRYSDASNLSARCTPDLQRRFLCHPNPDYVLDIIGMASRDKQM